MKHRLGRLLSGSQRAQADEIRKRIAMNWPRIEWCVIGASVQGASHVRTGLPNQDALAWRMSDPQGSPLTLALADGHGSNKCFRSKTGANLAVEEAISAALEFHSFITEEELSEALIVDQFFLENLSTDSLFTGRNERITELGYSWLVRRIVEGWIEAVNNDVRKKAFTEEELHNAPAYPIIAYGSTLLAVLVTEKFILYIQLGDGDILTISDTGEVSRPIPKDDNLIANETYSLCLPNAWELFRLGHQPLSDPPPAMIMLSTDGYSNSFKTNDDFYKVAMDFLFLAQTEGEAVIRQNLETWLIETSELASGDDITLGLLFRKDILKKTLQNNSY